MTVKIAESDQEILSCFEAMRELRTHLKKTSFAQKYASSRTMDTFLRMLQMVVKLRLSLASGKV